MTRISVVIVAFAALFWGVSGGIGGLLLMHGWDPFVVSLYRGAVGLLFILLWLLLRPGGNGFLSLRLWFWSVIAGLGIAGNFAFYFVSIAEGSIAVAATLMYSAPVFVYLVSFMLKLESPTPLKWAAIAMVMLGVVLLTRIYTIGAGDTSPISTGAGLLSGLSYTLFIFGFKYAAPHGSPQAILTIAFAVMVSLLIWPADSEQTVSVLSATDWPLFVVLGVLGAGLSFILYILGLNHTSPAVASIVSMIEPVTASLFGIFLLSQTLVGVQVLGMALILVTVTAMSVKTPVQINLDDNK